MADWWEASTPVGDTAASASKGKPEPVFWEASEPVVPSSPKKKMNAAEDFAAAVPSLVPRTAGALAGLPTTVINSGAGVLPRAARWVDDNVLSLSPEDKKYGAESILSRMGIKYGQDPLPDVGALSVRGWEELGVPVHQPQTPGGRIADFTAQNLLMMGRPSVKNSLQMGVAGLSGGASGELARAYTDNPAVIAGAQMGGSLAGSLPFALRSSAGEIANDALKNVTPAQFDKAQLLMDQARQMGAPITAAEAIAQTLGGSRMQAIQRWAEQSPGGSAELEQFMAGRAGGNRSAVTNALEQVGPKLQGTEIARIPAKMQQAAKAQLEATRREGNAQAKPAYDAAYAQSVPGQIWASMTDDPVIKQALDEAKRDPKWRATDAKDGSVQWLDSAKKILNDKVQSSLAKQENSAAAVYREALDKLTTSLDSSVPAYAKARGIVRDHRQQYYNPMEQSPVGNLRDTTNPVSENMMAQQSQILMPQAPKVLNPDTIRYTVRQIEKQDPTAAKNWVRQNLESIFDESAQKLQSGDNPAGGAKFAAQVAGNPNQMANLEALVTSVAGNNAWEGMKRLLQVFEAQGKRLGAGSPTESNRLITESMSVGPGRGISRIASPSRATEMVADWYDKYRINVNAGDLARLITSPDGVRKLQAIARENPNSARYRALVSEALSLSPATQDEK